MTTGSKVLLFYLGMTYGVQSILSLLFPSLYYQDYRGYTDGLFLKILLMVAIGFAIFAGQSFLSRRFLAKRQDKDVNSWKGVLVHWARMIAATIFLGLSIPFGLEYGFSFFHSGLYISDLPLWVVALQGMKSIARLDLAYCMIKVLRGEKLNNSDLYATLIYTFGGAISLAGAIDIVFLILGLLMIYGRGQLVMRALASLEGQAQRSRRWVVYSLLIATLPLVAIIGFANKIGFERTFDIVSDNYLFRESFAIPLALRVSSSHGSFIANTDLPLSLNEQIESVSYPVNNMTWRGCVLFIGTGCPFRADITHIARLNYVRTFWDQSPLKAGATPGLLASALYLPFLPLAIFVLAFYCSLFTSAIDRAVGTQKLPLPGVVALVLFTYPAFENPIDLLVIFDPAVVYTIGLFLILNSFRPLRNVPRISHGQTPRPPAGPAHRWQAASMGGPMQHGRR